MGRLPALRTALAALCLTLLCVGLADARVVELGATPSRPAASCPANCFAIGRLSGFQVTQGSITNPYRVKRSGKIVAFSITLGSPDAKQVEFFTNLFGGAPQAQLSVLRREFKIRMKPHRLVSQSRVFDLAPYMGSTPTFALARPLTIKARDTVALTVPTWAPAFAVGLPKEEAWRSSRHSDKCDDVNTPAAQQKLTGLRRYACVYRTARLLYTATFIPDPRPTTPAAAPEKG